MPQKLEAGFLKADSTNLPIVGAFAVWDFLSRDKRFTLPECQNVKTASSARESYGDSAIGYVSLRRDNSICTVSGMVCPEHKIREKDYQVILKIDEKFGKVIQLKCNGCAAAEGGCKHAVSFLFWVHRRTESPSPTETECYWRRSKLSSIGSSMKYICAREIWKPNSESQALTLPDDSNFLRSVIHEAKNRQLDSQLSRHNFDLESRKLNQLSMHQLICSFVEDQENEIANGQPILDHFLTYMKNKLPEGMCKEVEIGTRNQSDCLLWYEMRYGRLTGSKLHESAHCKTSKGSLVNQIIGASKIPDSIFMVRGRTLESEVLSTVGKLLKIKIQKVGFLLIPSLPMVGASPDGILDDFIFEVKCPAKTKTVETYVKKGEINPKFKAQMMLQMLAAGKKKGLLCIADVAFEKNKKVEVFELAYDENFINEIIDSAVAFWKGNIFPHLYQAASSQDCK
ncbi:hypothetical protein QAD02_004425 [Eretmocerus hayati]|uniref:Uncharacterized protein n=1 Tax=Eretmocerus hayati TaxID=131215 RepID=A0ACC2NPR3_9HYME|nr:hypothetical protein QAD02_004425 [Eretmocerus hayati]